MRRGVHLEHMTRRLAAIATALAGVVTLTSSLSANEPGRQALLEAFEPGSAQAAAHALGAIGGLLTLWLAIGVLRGRRPAARAAVIVLGVLAVVHLAKGLDYEEALIALVLAFALHRGIEQASTDRPPSRSLVAMLALLVGVAGAYASTLTVLLVSGHSAGLGPTLWVAARSLAGGAPAAVGGDARTLLHLAGAFAVGAVVIVLRALLAPAHARDGHGAHEHDRAAAIVAAHGGDSIAPFALRADKAYFFSHGGVVAYRTLRETAVVAGDPVCPPGAAGAILGDFEAFARGRGWDVVVLGARGENLGDYSRLGLRTMQVGLEAVVAPREFDLDAPGAKTVRKAVRRVARRGWTIELVRGDELTPPLIADLAAVEGAWRRRGHRRLYGFAMAGDRLWGAPEDRRDLYALARNPEGEARAFQRYVPYRGGLSLDAMRRLDDDPNGISDALVAATLQHAAALGLDEVSLNFAGFGHLMAAESLERRSHRAARWALQRLHGRFQLERLARFANKFGPSWRPRFLVYTHRTRLPLAALRVMQAEAYLKSPAARPAQGAWRPAPRPITGATSAPSAISPAATQVAAR
jgi:lysyl-tRNA synthetase, class II